MSVLHALFGTSLILNLGPFSNYYFFSQVWCCHTFCWTESSGRKCAKAFTILQQQLDWDNHSIGSHGCPWMQKGKKFFLFFSHASIIDFNCSKRVSLIFSSFFYESRSYYLLFWIEWRKTICILFKFKLIQGISSLTWDEMSKKVGKVK